MWDRKELKAKGKESYKANRLMCIIAALILSLTGGAGGSIGASGSPAAKQTSDVDTNTLNTITDEQTAIILTSVVIAIIVILIIAFIIQALLLNPLLVGAKKFFVDNSGNPEASLSSSNIGLAFNGNYKTVIAAMFSTQIIVFLWSLLLIVPGIIKAYEYRMVAYIISENPEITGKEARELSSQMMNGQKWNTFVLDLSFLGWIILGCCTFGILNLIFVNPYKAATDAELYLTLKNPASYDAV